MSIKKVVCLLPFIAVLCGCGKGAELSGSPKTTHPIRQGALNLKPAAAYYPIPPLKPGGQPANKDVSIVPPGQNVAPIRQSTTSHTVKKTSQLLKVQGTMAQVWPKVQRALEASGYRIMDKDRELAVFYIILPTRLGKRLSSNTPIYKVQLKSSANNLVSIALLQPNGRLNQRTAMRVMQQLRSLLG